MLIWLITVLTCCTVRKPGLFSLICKFVRFTQGSGSPRRGTSSSTCLICLFLWCHLQVMSFTWTHSEIVALSLKPSCHATSLSKCVLPNTKTTREKSWISNLKKIYIIYHISYIIYHISYIIYHIYFHTSYIHKNYQYPSKKNRMPHLHLQAPLIGQRRAVTHQPLAFHRSAFQARQTGLTFDNKKSGICVEML